MNIKDAIKKLPDGSKLGVLHPANFIYESQFATADLKALVESHGRLLVVAKWLDAHLDDYFIDKLPKEYAEAKAAIEEAEKL